MRAVIPWHRRQRGVGVQTHPFFESRRILLAPLRVVSSRATTRSQNGVMTSSTDCDGSDSKSTSRLPTKPATATRVGVTRESLAQTALSLPFACHDVPRSLPPSCPSLVMGTPPKPYVAFICSTSFTVAVPLAQGKATSERTHASPAWSGLRASVERAAAHTWQRTQVRKGW